MKNFSIETPRLLLRPPILADLERFTDMRGDFERSKWAGGGLDAAGAWSRFGQWVGNWQLYGYGMFSIIEKSSGNWIGNVGPVKMFDWPGQEFGWALIGEKSGQGFAKEAALAALDWSFKNLQFGEFCHCIHPDNVASIKLAQAIGAQFVDNSPLPPPFEDEPNEKWVSIRK